MAKGLKISYLEHSGFVVDTGSNILVFDYYKDPAGIIDKLIPTQKKVWVFSSHSHADHFSQVIGKWSSNVESYILSDDIRVSGGLAGTAGEKAYYMKPYETSDSIQVKVTTYGSTDEGVSFLVEVDGWKIFHAGDLNWWHWKEDTAENIQLAEEGFRREMSHLAGLKLDLVFFPVDSRLEEYRAIGVEEFCRQVDTDQLVVMHTCGKHWTAPEDFPGNDKTVAVWCPAAPGEQITMVK